MRLTIDFTGANINIISRHGNTYTVEPDLRDTTEPWFYWAFGIDGSAGEKVRVNFAVPNCIGYFGPAVSDNLEGWCWLGSGFDENSFEYTFEADKRVYFAHDMLYHPSRFYDFTKKNKLEYIQLCISEKGRSVPALELGDGDKVILLTARHHACEATGDYILEGMMTYLSDRIPRGYKIVAVPFVDYDGVADGDQGKSRAPHDHNRDYIEKPIYSSVRAIKKYIDSHDIKYAFDLHSPWHMGGKNDLIFLVRKDAGKLDSYERFGTIFGSMCSDDTLTYENWHDIAPDEGWNKCTNALYNQCSAYCDHNKDAEIAVTVETPYFGTIEDAVSQQKLINTGIALAKALEKYMGE